jgi:hypothetical protein
MMCYLIIHPRVMGLTDHELKLPKLTAKKTFLLYKLTVSGICCSGTVPDAAIEASGTTLCDHEAIGESQTTNSCLSFLNRKSILILNPGGRTERKR